MSGPARRTHAPKNCAACGAPLSRRANESSANYTDRFTCGRSCANRLRSPGPEFIPRDCGYTTNCWEWQKATTNGYGVTYVGGRLVRAHRVYYEDIIGPIPEGLPLDHLCRNRRCVNPTHLEPVTNAENSRRGARAKLTPEVVATIRTSPLGARKLAAEFGVTPATIAGVRKGRTWVGVGETT